MGFFHAIDSMDNPAPDSAGFSETSGAAQSTMDSSPKEFPPKQSGHRGQKRPREEHSDRERGTSRERGARGGRNKRADMGRSEWRYGGEISADVPYPLINEVGIHQTREQRLRKVIKA